MIDKVPYTFWFAVLGIAVIAVWPFLSSLNPDDVCYGSLLLFCTVFGHFYRKLTEPFLKQWVATVVGFSVVCVVSGVHILRPLGVTLANAIFISVFKKYCHILSFVFTFGFLTLFRTTDYFGQPYLPGPMNLVNMVLTMRMVAVAFDAHDSYVAKKKKLPPTPQDVDPSFLDIFHYAFCYVGVLTGPFFRYKTYVDLVNTPFSSGAKSWNILFNRVKMLPVFIVAFVMVSKLYPLKKTRKVVRGERKYRKTLNRADKSLKNLELEIPKLMAILLLCEPEILLKPGLIDGKLNKSMLEFAKEAHTDEFYSERSLLYRLYYMNVNFFIFRMRMYTGILLSECVCIAAGLGAYPVWCKARLGTGPTERHEDLAILAGDLERVPKEEYNFETVRNLDWYLCEVEPTVRGAMKSWNMSVQYWLAAYVYKRFPVKAMRTLATFIMSALWHGTYVGYYLCIVSVAPYLMVEDVYDKKFRQPAGPTTRRILDVVFWICRLQAFSYMSITFQLLTVEASFRYWRSLHYLYHWIWLALFMYPLSLTVKSLIRSKKRAP